MLISTMNRTEVTREFYRDLQIIAATTLVRLGEEYQKERKKFKIKPESFYPKVYHIKTKSKNKWTIFLCKAPSAETYKARADTSYCCITSYHSKKGLEVLRELEEINGIECFWGHFFYRYQQRMGLDIPSIEELIEHYFFNNLFIQHCVTSMKTGKNIGICREGFAFGQLTNNGTWLVNKTFVSNKTANSSQKKFAGKLIDLIQQDLVTQLAAKQFDANKHLKTKELLQDLKRV